MERITFVLYFGLFYLCLLNIKEVQSQDTDVAELNGTRTCNGPEACVYEAIFSGYNRLTRPVQDYNKTIMIKLEFVFNALMDIEEKDEIMRVVGFFRAFWQDELLKWDPKEYEGVTSITVPAQNIWLPDLGITNSVSRFYEVTYKRDFHLQIEHTGKIRWSFGGILTTSCDIDLSFYPFDHQHCSIELESWQYPKDKLMLELYQNDPVNLAAADDDPQWILKGGSAETYLKYEDRFSAVKFTLHWERKPLYYYVNIIVPGAYIALITLGVFWLPIECGEKMSLGITVVLAFSVFQIVIMDITPVSSDAVPQITEMVVMVMTLATASLLSSMFVSYLSDYETPPPRWVKKIFLYYIPKVLRMSSYDIYKEEITGAPDRKDPEGKVRDPCNQHLLSKNHQLTQESSRMKTGQENSVPIEDEHMQGNPTETSNVDKSEEYVGLDNDDQTSHTKANVKEILSLLQHMKERFSEEEEGKKIKEYWKYVGMAFDRVVFWIAFTVFAVYLVYAFVSLQVAKHASQEQ